MDVQPSPIDVEKLYNILAVVGRVPLVTMAALAGAPLPQPLWRALARQPGVSEEADELALHPAVAEQRLQALEQKDRLSYRQLHQNALDLLAKEVSLGESALEVKLVAIFKRLADHLLAEREESFQSLVASAQLWPLRLEESVQWRRYYQGVCELEQGNYDAALRVFDEVLVHESLDQRLVGRTLNSRANVYRVKGRLEDALQGYQESLHIWQTNGDEQNEGKTLLNMGTAAYFLQEYTTAEPWLHAAAALFKKQKMAVLLGAAENGLGLLCRDQGRWEDALGYFQSFIAHSEARGSSDSVSIGLLNCGEVYLFQGQIEQAIETLHRSLAHMQRRLYAVDVHLHLGLAYWASGKLTQAQHAFQEAAQLAYDLDRKEILPHVEYWLAVLALALGKAAEAEARLLAAVQIIEQTRAPISNEALKISLLGRWQQIYEALVLYYIDNKQPQEAFQWAERARARAFAEALLKANTTSVDDPKLQNGIVAELQGALPAGASLLCYFTTGVLASDIPMLSAIPADNPLRKHLLTSARTLCFVVSRESFAARECTIDPNLFAMVSPRGYDVNQWLDPAVLDHLSQTLLDGISVNPALEQLFIVPHGPLHLVPFVALLSSRKRPSIPEPTITYASNATVLWHSLMGKNSRPAATSALAVGYNGIRHGRSLRYTEAEVNAVAALLAGDALVGADAKKERLNDAVQDKMWLHFACHGWFNHELPLASYLETGEEERLSALEVMERWKVRARLVTLSACQTGVSRVLRGDEPMGLIRGFLYAGAQAVLVTQWPVEDLATCLLMIRFYQEVTSSPAPDLSRGVLAAQQWLRDLTVNEAQAILARFDIDLPADEALLKLPLDARPFTSPRFWAAFKLVVGS
jgi:tetratricopeptide (TPR) repeat protein